MLSSFYFLSWESQRLLRSLSDHDIYVTCSAGVRSCCLLCWWPLTSNRLSCNPLKNTILSFHSGTCHNLISKHLRCTPHILQLHEIFALRRQLAFPPILFHQNTLLAPGRKPRSSLLSLFFFCSSCLLWIHYNTDFSSIIISFPTRPLPHSDLSREHAFISASWVWLESPMPVGAPREGHRGEALQVPMHRG